MCLSLSLVQLIPVLVKGGHTVFENELLPCGFNPLCNVGRLEKEAGVILLGTGGSIPSMSVEKMETSCIINEKKMIHPFAYRTHTHSLGE